MEASSTPKTHYDQFDERWGDDIMGTDTLRMVGCLVSSVAMLLHSRGIQINKEAATPGTLNAWLKENNGYKGDLFIWASVDKLGIKFIKFTENHASIQEYLSDEDYEVILNVNEGGHYRIN